MKISIDIKEYRDLVEDSLISLMLCCLESAGVDNWDGYSYAYTEYEEALEELKNRVNETLNNS